MTHRLSWTDVNGVERSLIGTEANVKQMAKVLRTTGFVSNVRVSLFK